MAFFRIFYATMIIPPKKTSVSDPDWIQILSGQWIWIRIRNPDPDPVLPFNLGTFNTLWNLLRQCHGSGSICFWASWIRVLPYLNRSVSGLLFEFLSLKSDVNAVFQIRIPRFRIRIQHFRQFCGSGSGIRCFLNPVSGMGIKSGSGSSINNQDHISESLETNFWVKILKFFIADPGSGMENLWILDPG